MKAFLVFALLIFSFYQLYRLNPLIKTQVVTKEITVEKKVPVIKEVVKEVEIVKEVPTIHEVVRYVEKEAPVEIRVIPENVSGYVEANEPVRPVFRNRVEREYRPRAFAEPHVETRRFAPRYQIRQFQPRAQFRAFAPRAPIRQFTPRANFRPFVNRTHFRRP